MAQRNRFDSRERSLRRGLGRAQDSLDAKPLGSLGDRENSSDGPQASVERELTDNRVRTERLGFDLAGGGEDRQGDG